MSEQRGADGFPASTLAARKILARAPPENGLKLSSFDLAEELFFEVFTLLSRSCGRAGRRVAHSRRWT